MKNMGGSGRDAYGSCFFIPLVPVFNLVVRRGNREFHVQIRHRVLPIPFLRLGSSSTRKKFLRISPSFSSRVKKDRCAHDSKNSESRHRPMTILSIRALFHGWRSFAASAIIGIETHASDHVRMLRHKFAVRAEYVQRGSWRNEKEKRKKEKRHSRSANVSCTHRATPGNEGAHRRGQLSTAEMQKFDLCVGTLPRAMLRYERSHMWTVMPRIHARVNMQVYIYIYIYIRYNRVYRCV